MFKNFEETKYWIEHIKKFGTKLDLSRITLVMERLGHPERSFPTIHVGGTNGKGSTASYIKNILMKQGFKVGLYTSPYIVKFNERITINNQYIEDEELVRYTNMIYPIWEELHETGNTVTFFELMTAICFLYFRDQLIDFGVIEVGLGGTLDATNVIIPEVSVITNISYDHMNVLGYTLESIARNKLGIVKEGVPLVTAFDQDELRDLFLSVTTAKHAKMIRIDCDKVSDINIEEITTFYYEDVEYRLQLPGFHQIKNAITAIEAIKQLDQRLTLNISKEAIQTGLYETKWPGRFEVFYHNIILDGAHNIGGINALKQTMLTMYPDKTIKCLVSIMHDKEHHKMVDVLDTFCDELYFTEFEYERRLDAKELFMESKHKHKMLYPDYKPIFEQLKQLSKDEVLLVTGSLYFISAVRKLLTN